MAVTGAEIREKWTLAVARPATTNQANFEDAVEKIGVFSTKFELDVLLEKPEVNRTKTTMYIMRGENAEPVWENEENFLGGSIEILAQLKPASAVLRTLASSFVFEGRLNPTESNGVVPVQPRVNGFHVKPYQRENLSGVRLVIWISDVRSAMFKDMEQMPLVSNLKRLFVQDFGREYDAVQFTPHFNRSAFDYEKVSKRNLKDELTRVKAEYEGAGFKVSPERKSPRRGAGDGDAEGRKKHSAGRGEKKTDHQANNVVDASATNGNTPNGSAASTQNGLPPVETKCYGKHNGKSLVNNKPIAGVGHGSGGVVKPVVNGGEGNFGFERAGTFEPPPSTQKTRSAHGREDPTEWNAPRPRVNIHDGNRGDEWTENNNATNKLIEDAELLSKLSISRETSTNPVANPAHATNGGGAFGFATITSPTTNSNEVNGSAKIGVGRGMPPSTPTSSSSPGVASAGRGSGGGAGRGATSVVANGSSENISPVVSKPEIGGSGVGGGRGKLVAN